MKKIIILLNLFLSFEARSNSLVKGINFLSSMCNSEYTKNNLEKILENEEELEFFSVLQEAFEAFQEREDDQNEFIIPKIIHQIWLGSKKIPPQCLEYMKTWQEKHPGWKYILWTDEMVNQLSLTNFDLYKKCENMGEKSDILRYELLYQFGGLYVDVDFECLESFENLHRSCDFYTGLLQPEKMVLVANGLIGCRPGHPLVLEMIKALQTTWYFKAEIVDRTGPEFMTRLLKRYLKGAPGINVIFPAAFFYPFSWTQKHEDLRQWNRPETKAVHYFTGTWHSS